MLPTSILSGTGRFGDAGADATNSRGTVLTKPGSAHTKGAYAQLIASTPFDADGLIVQASNAGLLDCLVDIAIGAAASEQIIAPDLLVSGRNDNVYFYWIPLNIPASTRLSARYQATGTTTDLYCKIILVTRTGLLDVPMSRLTAYGAASADSGGVSVDPGATANTKGSYSQIVASTTNNIRALMIAIGNAANNVGTAGNILLDLAIGAAASEQIIIPDVWFQLTANENATPNVLGPFIVDIPAGTRLAVRAQSSIIDATDRLFDVVIYGVD